MPSGVRFGNIVHEILETIPFKDLAAKNYDFDVLKQLCSRYQLEMDLNELAALLFNVVTSSLPGLVEGRGSFSLSELATDDMIVEMGFNLSMGQVSTSEVNRVLAEETTVTPLTHKAMEGYLTGFIDLFCCHHGTYYVIDYKTNYLGEGLDSYSREQMQTAMLGHNYGLQYWLYTLAVHRYLTRFLPGYSYNRDFGGVMYLFVRGMSPEINGSGVYFERPDESVLRELDYCFGSDP